MIQNTLSMIQNTPFMIQNNLFVTQNTLFVTQNILFGSQMTQNTLFYSFWVNSQKIMTYALGSWVSSPWGNIKRNIEPWVGRTYSVFQFTSPCAILVMIQCTSWGTLGIAPHITKESDAISVLHQSLRLLLLADWQHYSYALNYNKQRITVNLIRILKGDKISREKKLAKYRVLGWKNLFCFSIHASLCNSCDDSMYILRYIRDCARHITKESDAISFLHQSRRILLLADWHDYS